MSLVDDLAGLPGGAVVADALRPLDHASPSGAENLAKNWRTTATQCAAEVPTLSKAWHDAEDGLAGITAENGRALVTKLIKAGAELEQATVSAADALDRAAGSVLRAQDFARSRSEWLLSWVRSQDAVYPDVAADSRSSAISAAAKHIATEIRSVTDAAAAELDTTAAALRKATAGAPTFSKITIAATVASPGQKPQVKPVAHLSEQAATNPEAHRGGDNAQIHEGHNGQSSGGGASGGGASGGGDGGGGDGGNADGGSGDGGGGSGPSGPPPTGEVRDWITEALRILRESGVDISSIDPADLAAIIQHESGGNPHAQNNWDSNAAAGHPSKGLMQTIPSTFDAYKLPGYDDIWNPVHNIIAAVRYALKRYGSIDNVPGVAGLENGQGYVGY